MGSVEPGRPWPLGVELLADGANVAVVAAHAERIELCLLDPDGRRELARLRLPGRTDDVHHGFVPGLRAGQVYGLRAHGPWDPARGHRFNPARLLLDPYAKELVGAVRWAGPNLVDPQRPLDLDPRDSAPFVPKAVMRVPPPPLAPLGRAAPDWTASLVYELHVKAMTARHPAVPAAARGRYAGLAHPAVLEHLLRLGVTTVELMPVAAFVDERALVERGLVNAWGYNPLAFMAAEPRYAGPGGEPLAELRAAVAALHAAGLEVILDIVLNHTAETDHLGPTLSLRGLDNALYYRLRPDDRARYVDDTGTGNTLDTAQPRVVQLAMDTLRFWAAQGVDGFRFDLGTVLGRGRDGSFDADAPLLQAIRQDPALGGLKLVVEPWDIGPGGWRLGAFPPPFAQWNDRFRDTVRRFWRGDEAMVPELAARLLGSADLLEPGRRVATAGVNFLAAHDGFTLHDLVAYGRRHNEANGEDNRDGHHASFSTNHGVEGPSDDPVVRDARLRHLRALLATLLLAQGVPMLAMGDELLRSQQGNNNAYCQDGPAFWVPWDALDPEAAGLLAFVCRLAALRRAQPALRRGRFLHGRVHDAHGVPDVLWLDTDAAALSPTAWEDRARRRLVLLVNGRAVLPGEPAGDVLLLALNAAAAPCPLVLPTVAAVGTWTLLLDSAQPEQAASAAPGDRAMLAGRGVALYAGRP